MTEQLIIRHFGPIKEAKIELGSLTAFVGPQATGKSIAAQLLYFFRGIEELLLFDQESKEEATLSALESWLGNPIQIYMTSDSLIRWIPAGLSEDEAQEIRWDSHQGIQLNEALGQRILKWQKADDDKLPRKAAWQSASQIYIPAGRILYSFFPPHALLSRQLASLSLGWPGYGWAFYQRLGSSIRKLWQDQEQGQLINGNHSATTFLRQRIEQVIKGQIRYGPETVLLSTNQKLLTPATMAAGQMEIWPFFAIVEAALSPLHAAKSSPSLTSNGKWASHIYFEEPEAHLHPDAQRLVMEIVSYLVRQKEARFVITTHSPYILYAINNFLMAHHVLDAGRDLPANLTPQIILHPENVSAYRFAPDGIVHDIIDPEVGLIDEDELDRVADHLASTFAELQESLRGVW